MIREIQDKISMVTHNDLVSSRVSKISVSEPEKTPILSKALDKVVVMMSEMLGCFRKSTQFKGQTLKHVFNYVGPASPFPYV